MSNIYENRRNNLKRLIDEHNDPATGRGGTSFVAKRARVAAAQLSCILLQRPVFPTQRERKKVTGRFHKMGDDIARRIEAAFDMEPSTLDRPSTIQFDQAMTMRQQALLARIRTLIAFGVLTDPDCDCEIARLSRTYPLPFGAISASTTPDGPVVPIFASKGHSKTNIAALLTARGYVLAQKSSS